MGINVLSQFDGISCGQLALQRAGVPVDNYFASEIDKYAIQIAQKNFPNTIQLGDVKNWRSWDLPRIDLLIAGSPCQGFSIAGKRLNFEDPRSKLFFEFVDTLEHLREENPDIIFLLENVNRMHKDVKAEISRILGVEPIMINSALVSAQNRERLYWTNIQGVTQPEDRGLILADILEDGDVDREKSYALDANYWKGGNPDRYFRKGSRQLVFNKIVRVGNLYPSGGMAGRIYSVQGKSPTLNTASTGGNQETKIAVDEKSYRKLTPVECERLQTLPDGFTEGISNSQRYKAIGNGWTVDVIAHIFSFLPKRFFEK